MRRSCSDSLLTASQMDGVFGSDTLSGSSKTQSGLDLWEMSEARYRRPIHYDCTDGAHHGSAKKYQSTRTCGRIVLAGIVPFIGFGHENLRSQLTRVIPIKRRPGGAM